MRKWMNLLESIAEDVLSAPKAADQSPAEELTLVRAELDELKAQHAELISGAREPGFEERKNAFISKVADRWTYLADREWELMQAVGEAGSRKSLREFFNSK